MPKETDVVVIGAGFTGLSAALTLARAGKGVIVCDAKAPGYGASSRNGGMIGGGHRLGFKALARRYGENTATDILNEGLASLEYAISLIESEGIDCAFVRSGRFRAACRPDDYEEMARDLSALKHHVGVDADLISRIDQHREVATDFYHGGIIYHRHGGLHPALFHHGLLERTRAAGALVAGFTPVLKVRRKGGGFFVDTLIGGIAAGNVVIATNGYSRNAVPSMARRVLPLSSYIIATEDVGEAQARAVIPGGRMIVESRALHGYYRIAPDRRRILFGGRAALHAIDPITAGRRLYRYLTELYPQLTGVRIEHSWSGHIAFTRDDMPHIGVHDGLHYAMGYGGSGVAMAPYLGYRVAHKVLGTRDGDTAFDKLPFRAYPFYGGNPWFLPIVDRYYRWRMKLFG